jgi:hypothetical protein
MLCRTRDSNHQRYELDWVWGGLGLAGCRKRLHDGAGGDTPGDCQLSSALRCLLSARGRIQDVQRRRRGQHQGPDGKLARPIQGPMDSWACSRLCSNDPLLSISLDECREESAREDSFEEMCRGPRPRVRAAVFRGESCALHSPSASPILAARLLRYAPPVRLLSAAFLPPGAHPRSSGKFRGGSCGRKGSHVKVCSLHGGMPSTHFPKP